MHTGIDSNSESSSSSPKSTEKPTPTSPWAFASAAVVRRSRRHRSTADWKFEVEVTQLINGKPQCLFQCLWCVQHQHTSLCLYEVLNPCRC